MKKFYARFSPFNQDYDLYIKDKFSTPTGHTVVTSIQLVTEEFKLGTAYGPSASLSECDAQGLFDALWEAGLRPNSGESSKAHVEQLSDLALGDFFITMAPHDWTRVEVVDAFNDALSLNSRR